MAGDESEALEAIEAWFQTADQYRESENAEGLADLFASCFGREALEDEDEDLDAGLLYSIEEWACQHLNNTENPETVGPAPCANPLALEAVFSVSQFHPQLNDLTIVISNNPFCSESLLGQLVRVDNPWETTSTRIHVACNPSATPSVLSSIWNTVGEFEGTFADDITWCLASNPRTPVAILAEIAKSPLREGWSVPVGDDEPELASVAGALLRNPSTPRDERHSLSTLVNTETVTSALGELPQESLKVREGYYRWRFSWFPIADEIESIAGVHSR